MSGCVSVFTFIVFLLYSYLYTMYMYDNTPEESCTIKVDIDNVAENSS